MVRGEVVLLSVIGKICLELRTDIVDSICIDKTAEEYK